MYRLPLSTINASLSAIDQLQQHALLNNMEKALLQDAAELIAKIQRYTLVYKIEVY